MKKTIRKNGGLLFTTCAMSVATPFVSAATVDISNAGVSAWSTTGASSAFATASAIFYSGGGYGVTNTLENGTTPNHSMDNSGPTDLLELTFAQTVDLDSVTIGWHFTDSDISVLAYTGVVTGTPPPVQGRTIAQLMGSGWSLVGNYADMADNTAKSVNASNVSSKWWLVSSYNAVYTTATGGSLPSLTSNDDYVKILAVSGTYVVPPPSKVPEPGSMALFAAAAFGLYAVRRRGSQRRV